MGWKSWPYWLRGGLISALSLVLFFLLVSVFFIIVEIIRFGFHITKLVGYFFAFLYTLPVTILALIIPLVFFFGVGALIGFLIGKSKK